MKPISLTVSLKLKQRIAEWLANTFAVSNENNLVYVIRSACVVLYTWNLALRLYLGIALMVRFKLGSAT